MSHECTEERFLRDVADHRMIVIRDDGVNRHIRFKQPDSGNMHFDLITWPGHLCYTGDMGTYVFQRLEDMFEFFRTDRLNRRDPAKLYINLPYWTEKLVAIDGNRSGGKVKPFDEAKFRKVINQYRVDWMRSAKESGELDADGRRELWEAVESDVIGPLEDGGVERALWAAYEFYHKDSTGGRKRGWMFDDLWDNDFTEYSHSIVWCCYALAWAIRAYDAAKQVKVAAVAAETPP